MTLLGERGLISRRGYRLSGFGRRAT
jgi:hypothetical protein